MLDVALTHDVALKAPNHLMNPDRDATVGAGGNRHRLDLRVNLRPLPPPVLADRVATMEPSSPLRVGPVDVVAGSREHRIDIAGVAALIEAAQPALVVHQLSS